MNIEGVAAIITGGCSAPAGGTAERLARRGAKTTILDLNDEMGTALAQETGGHFIRVDVTDEQAVANAISEAGAVNGNARILVNCAGIGPPAKVIDRDGKPARQGDWKGHAGLPAAACVTSSGASTGKW